MAPEDEVFEVWQRALAFAWLLAKGARSAELRGDRRSKTFDAEGLHSYSTEWGRVRACEEVLPGLEEWRAGFGPVAMRALAFREAEDDFETDARAGRIEWHRG